MNTLQDRLQAIARYLDGRNYDKDAEDVREAANRIDALEAEANRLSEHATVIRNQRDEALAKLVALTEDAERLDWLDRDGKTKVLSIVDTWYTRAAYGRPHTKHRSRRQAIDAAIAAQKEQV